MHGDRSDSIVSRGDAMVVGARNNKTPRPVWAGGDQETSMARAQTHWSSGWTLVAYRARLLRLLINRSLRENLPYHNSANRCRTWLPPNVNILMRFSDARMTTLAFCNSLLRQTGRHAFAWFGTLFKSNQPQPSPHFAAFF